MINIRARIVGEPNAHPYHLAVQCNTQYEEMIFMNSVKAARAKLGRNLKLNVNESMMLYYACVVERLRTHTPLVEIQSAAQKLLTSDSVLIGVGESLRDIEMVAAVDKLPQVSITLKNPICPATARAGHCPA